MTPAAEIKRCLENALRRNDVGERAASERRIELFYAWPHERKKLTALRLREEFSGTVATQSFLPCARVLVRYFSANLYFQLLASLLRSGRKDLQDVVVKRCERLKEFWRKADLLQSGAADLSLTSNLGSCENSPKDPTEALLTGILKLLKNFTASRPLPDPEVIRRETTDLKRSDSLDLNLLDLDNSENGASKESDSNHVADLWNFEGPEEKGASKEAYEPLDFNCVGIMEQPLPNSTTFRTRDPSTSSRKHRERRKREDRSNGSSNGRERKRERHGSGNSKGRRHRHQV